MNDSFKWWVGVVEDRNDPEKLGRCRVRIFGYHIEDTNILPTKDLPWALPVQSINSAAVSGIGSSPTGIVPGTWVIGWFLDGEECQQPIMMGTISGKPSVNTATQEKIDQAQTLTNVQRDENNNVVYDGSNSPIKLTNLTREDTEKLDPLTKDDLSTVYSVISEKVSENNLLKVGDNNELGKFQFSVENLIDLGYIQRPAGDIDPSILDDDSYWIGKDGVGSKQSFLENSSAQESAMFSLTEKNYKDLIRLGKITDTEDPAILSGLLVTSHVAGTINSDKLDKKTDSGEKLKDYFIIGNKALGGDAEDYFKTFEDDNSYLSERLNTNSSESLNIADIIDLPGYTDPNKKYPKVEYAGLPDTNKLATGDTSHLLFKIKENKKIDKIPLARNAGTWNEPENAYAAVYPYNHVLESEAGHVIEIDSTPNAERIHVFHKSGTYIEIDVNGTMVRKVVGDNYEIIDRNNFVYVKGANNLTVEGKTNILVKNNASIEVEGNLTVTGRQDTLVQTAGTVGVISENAIINATKNINVVAEEDINLQGKNINLYAKGGSITAKSDRDVSLQSGRSGTLSLKGGLTVAIDALVVKTKMGANSIRALVMSTLKPPERKTPDTSEIPVLKRKIVKEEHYLFDSGELEAEEYVQQQKGDGKLSDVTPRFQSSGLATRSLIAPASNASSRRAEIQKGTVVDCTQISKVTYFPNNFKISKHFTLGHLLVGNSGSALVPQTGLTENDIVCNLKSLAVNVLDKVKDKYPDVRISSGFRILKPRNSISEHNIGAAADLIFDKRNFREYRNIAQWMLSNVPFRQLLLEYRFNRSELAAVWIHVSLQLDSTGNVINSTRSSVATFVNHKQYISNQLVNLA